MNRITLIGRLTRDPEPKETPSGKFLCKFSIACKGGKKDEFFDCVAWEKTAENIIKYRGKGDEIAVSGCMESSEYEKDGVKKKLWAVTAWEVEFIGARNLEREGINAAEQKRRERAEQAEIEDLPF